MIGQPHNGFGGQYFINWIIGFLSGYGVGYSENLVQIPGKGILLFPASEIFGYSVHFGNPPFCIGCNHSITNRFQGNAQIFIDLKNRQFNEPALQIIAQIHSQGFQ